MRNLPGGWIEVELGEVWCESRARVRPESITLTKYIGLEHVEGGTSRFVSEGRSDDVKSAVAVFSAGDILYGRLRPYLNKVIRPSFDGVASTEFLVFKETEALANSFLLRLLSSGDLVAYASNNSAGVNLPRISAERLARYRFPLAPLPEQHRIVAKIESLFAGLNEGMAALKRVQANLERYRLSVLQAAIDGKLTEQWRKENPPKESGEKLLERILAERRKRWENEQVAKFEAQGKRPPRGWQSRFKEPTSPDPRRLPELPQGWCWATVAQLAKTMTGGTPRRTKKEYFGGNIPWIKSGELGDGPVSQNEEFLSTLGLAESSANVFPAGTLCIALYGATVGRIGILEMEAATNQAVCGIVNPSLVCSDYLAVSFLANRDALVGRGRGGAQSNISQEIVRKTAISVPPLDEQVVITREVGRLLSAYDGQRETLAHLVDVRATTLRQSILKHALEGRLVPQDPDDKPASVLLRRIRARREADKKKRHSGRQNRTSKS